MNTPLVSIVIPNWNGRPFLRACLDGVYRQTYRRFEVIVVDDCSTDGSAGFIEQHYPQVRLLKNRTRLGFAGAANRGFAAAQGDFIATLDNDAIPSPAWLAYLVQALIRYGDRVAVVEGQVDHGGDVGVINGSLNLLSNNTNDVFGADQTQKFYPGFCSSIMRNHLIERYYDESYFFFQAEPYLGWLFRLRGYEVRREPKSVVMHHGSVWRKHRAIRQQYELLNERNRLVNMIIFYEPVTLLKIMPLNMLFSAFRFLAKLPTEPWKSYYMLKAYGWTLGHAGLVLKKRWAIQRQRKVPDRAITRFLSSRVFSGRPAFSRSLNRWSSAYCSLVGLVTVENAR